MAQPQAMVPQVPQPQQNLYNSQVFSLSEFYIQRTCPQFLAQQQQQQQQGWGAQQQPATAAWGQPQQSIIPSFGQTQQPFGTQSQTSFGQPPNPFGTQQPNQVLQPPPGITSIDQLNLLQTALDNSRSLRTGTLLEKMRQDMTGSQLQQQQQQQPPNSPNSKKLLDSLQSALLQQKSQEIAAPTFMSQIDHSQVTQLQNSAFQSDFHVDKANQNFGQIGVHQVNIMQQHVDFINPRAPLCSNYTTFPSIQQLQLYTDQQLQQVQNFAVYKYENNQLVGSLRFLYPVNLTNVNVDTVVSIDWKLCNLTFTQQTGYQLNVPAEVTLYGIQCPPGADVADYTRNISEITGKNGGRLIEYDPNNGVWKFQVDSFMG
ncbi:Nucleoporin autopeptidase [Spironucleus salmonicida]|nr:Nucleoporin autopeptidase [Spironucleus salmonicida]